MSTTLAKRILPGIFYVEDVSPKNTTEIVADNIMGTAFVIDEAEGWLLTAKHVLEDDDQNELTTGDIRVSSVFSTGANPSYALGTVHTVKQIIRDPDHDLALLQIHPMGTKRRQLPLGRGMEIAEPTLLFGFPEGTVHVYCDSLLGDASPKSPTPLVIHSIVSALVPHDGRPISLYVTDSRVQGGFSGGALVSCTQEAVCAVLVAGSSDELGVDVYGYSLPIQLGLDLLQSVSSYHYDPKS